MLKCDKDFLIFVYSEKRQNISRRKKKLQPLKFSGFIADLGMWITDYLHLSLQFGLKQSYFWYEIIIVKSTQILVKF